MVEVLSGYGIPVEKIAGVIGVSRPTVERYYDTELRNGASKVEANLVGNLFRLSKGNDGTALKATIFSLCTRFGWSQYVPRPEIPGKKEQALIEAEVAHEDSDWSELVH